MDETLSQCKHILVPNDFLLFVDLTGPTSDSYSLFNWFFTIFIGDVSVASINWLYRFHRQQIFEKEVFLI